MMSRKTRLIQAELLLKGHESVDQKLVNKALLLCKNQKRALFMMELILDARLSTQSVLATILLDVDYKTIKQEFGTDVLNLTKRTEKCLELFLSAKIKKELDEEFVTMIVSYAEDVRVMFLIISYTLFLLKKSKRRLVKNEIKNILRFISPLCYRLNLWKLKIEIEALCLKKLSSNEFVLIENKLEKLRHERKAYMQYCLDILKTELELHNIAIKANGRVKDIYSIYQKIKVKKVKFENIYDLIAMRIIVEEVDDCYKTLGIVHSLWLPHFEKIKDYIAIPKPNGYQSLHTTVLGPNDHYIEIQIRTKQMDYEAKYGIAAHWSYSKKKRSKIQKEKQPFWLKSLLHTQNTDVHLQDLRINLNQKKVSVLTEDGNVVQLPKPASVLDLAFKIDIDSATKINKCEINHIKKPITTILKDADLVKIEYAKQATLQKNWLEKAKTEEAQNAILEYLSGN